MSRSVDHCHKSPSDQIRGNESFQKIFWNCKKWLMPLFTEWVICVRIIRINLHSKMSHFTIYDFDCRDSLFCWLNLFLGEEIKRFENLKNFGNHKMYRMLSRRRILKFHQCWRFKSSSPIIPKDRFVNLYFRHLVANLWLIQYESY